MVKYILISLFMLITTFSVAQTSFGLETHAYTSLNFEKNHFVSYGTSFSLGPILHLNSSKKVSYQVSVLLNRENGSTSFKFPQPINGNDQVIGAKNTTVMNYVIYDLKLPIALKLTYDNNTALNFGVHFSHQIRNNVKNDEFESKNSRLIKDVAYGLNCGYGFSRKNVELLFSVEYNLNDRFEKYTDRSKIHTLSSGVNFRYYFGKK